MDLWVSFTMAFPPRGDGGHRDPHPPCRPIIGQMLATGHSPTARGGKGRCRPIVAARAKMIGLCALAFKGDLAWGR